MESSPILHKPEVPGLSGTFQPDFKILNPLVNLQHGSFTINSNIRQLSIVSK